MTYNQAEQDQASKMKQASAVGIGNVFNGCYIKQLKNSELRVEAGWWSFRLLNMILMQEQ